MPRHPRLIRYKPAPALVTHILGEFIGTFFLILTVSMCIQQSEDVGTLAPISIGFLLCSMVFSFGYLSSAVFNPSVAVSLWVLELMTFTKVVIYTVTHLVAGLAAAFLSWFLVGVKDDFQAPSPKTEDAIGIFRTIIAEFVFTFGLMTVVYHVACSRQRDNQHYGLGIGVFVTAAAYSVGGISGGAFNPAVATSLQVVLCIADNCNPLKYIWIYWIFPTLGAVAASFMFAAMHPVDIESDDDDGDDDDDGATTAKDALAQSNISVAADGEECTADADGNLICRIPGGGYLLHSSDADSGYETDDNTHYAFAKANEQMKHHHDGHHHDHHSRPPTDNGSHDFIGVAGAVDADGVRRRNPHRHGNGNGNGGTEPFGSSSPNQSIGQQPFASPSARGGSRSNNNNNVITQPGKESRRYRHRATVCAPEAHQGGGGAESSEDASFVGRPRHARRKVPPRYNRGGDGGGYYGSDGGGGSPRVQKVVALQPHHLRTMSAISAAGGYGSSSPGGMSNQPMPPDPRLRLSGWPFTGGATAGGGNDRYAVAASPPRRAGIRAPNSNQVVSRTPRAPPTSARGGGAIAALSMYGGQPHNSRGYDGGPSIGAPGGNNNITNGNGTVFVGSLNNNGGFAEFTALGGSGRGAGGRRLPRFADSKVVRKGEQVEEYYQDGRLIRTVHKASPASRSTASNGEGCCSSSTNTGSTALTTTAGTTIGVLSPLGADSSTRSVLPPVGVDVVPPPPPVTYVPASVGSTAPPAPPPPTPPPQLGASFAGAAGGSFASMPPPPRRVTTPRPHSSDPSSTSDGAEEEGTPQSALHYGTRVFVAESP